jgi:hypothetical protein
MVRVAKHVAHIFELRAAYRTAVGKDNGKRPCDSYGVDGSTILKLMFKEKGRVSVNTVHLAKESTSCGPFNPSNQHSTYIKDKEFIVFPSDQ